MQEAWLRLERAGGERVREPGGLADDRGGQGVPGRLAGAGVAAGGAPGALEAVRGQAGEPLVGTAGEGRGRPGAGGAAGRLGGAGPAGGAGHPRPAERVAFVLHDLFAIPFAEIAPLVGRSPAATRQLASRARRRVRARRRAPERT